MIRATVWTVGLFGAGAMIVRAFPGTWTEPLVLLALGIALLFASARTARSTATPAGARRGAETAPPVPASSRAASGTAAPLPATAAAENGA
jgi:hypothetical protein